MSHLSYLAISCITFPGLFNTLCGVSNSEDIYFCSTGTLRIFMGDLWSLFIFILFNSRIRPLRGCLKDGRKRGTLKEDAIISITIPEAPHGYDPTCRYSTQLQFYFDERPCNFLDIFLNAYNFKVSAENNFSTEFFSYSVKIFVTFSVVWIFFGGNAIMVVQWHTWAPGMRQPSHYTSYSTLSLSQ